MRDAFLILLTGTTLGALCGSATVALGGRRLESPGWILTGAVGAGLTMALLILAFGVAIDLGLSNAAPRD